MFPANHLYLPHPAKFITGPLNSQCTPPASGRPATSIRLARPSQSELPEFRHTVRLCSTRTPTPPRCPHTPPVRAGADSHGCLAKSESLQCGIPRRLPPWDARDKATHSESVPRTPGIHTAPSRPDTLTSHPDTLTHSHPPPQTLHPRRHNRSGRGGPGPSRCHRPPPPSQSAQLSHPAPPTLSPCPTDRDRAHSLSLCPPPAPAHLPSSPAANSPLARTVGLVSEPNAGGRNSNLDLSAPSARPPNYKSQKEPRLAAPSLSVSAKEPESGWRARAAGKCSPETEGVAEVVGRGTMWLASLLSP